MLCCQLPSTPLNQRPPPLLSTADVESLPSGRTLTAAEAPALAQQLSAALRARGLQPRTCKAHSAQQVTSGGEWWHSSAGVGASWCVGMWLPRQM